MANLNFNQAKKRFEETVKKMQDDLLAYAESGKASQKAVDYRSGVINTLIECYGVLLDQVNTLEDRDYKHSMLRWDTQKLVYWCHLHRVNPNGMFQYTEKELLDMLKRGRRFGRVKDIVTADSFEFKRLMMRLYTDDELSECYNFMDDPDTFNNEIEKYLSVMQKHQIDTTIDPETRKPLSLI